MHIQFLCFKLQESSRTLAHTHCCAVRAESFDTRNNNLTFSEWQSSKGKKGLCQRNWLSHKALRYSCSLIIIPLQQPRIECPYSKLGLSLRWQITSLWHNFDYGLKKGGDELSMMGNIRLLDPLCGTLRSLNESHSVLKPTNPCISRSSRGHIQ